MTDRVSSSRPPRSGARVLVVDDEPVLREAMAELLRDEGYRVEEAGNGAIALEIALTFKPDVVLFDWAMPIADGRALVESIRESMRPLPGLVAVSAAVSARAWCAENGVQFVVTKPFDDTTLIRAVDGALAQVRGSGHKPSKSGTQRAVQPSTCVIAVGKRDTDDPLTDDIPESHHHARIITVDRPEEAERVLDMVLPDLLVVDDDPRHDAVRALAIAKGIRILVRPHDTASSTRVLVAEALDKVSRG